MQRREQQKRAAAGLGGGSSYLGGGVTGYSPVPRFETPDFSSSASRSPQTSTPTPVKAPAFKGSGLKLGSKKAKQAELLDALGGDVLASAGLAEDALSTTPPAPEKLPATQKASGRGSLPEVEVKGYVAGLVFLKKRISLPFAYRVHIVIKESISISLLRDGGVQSMELKGDMNLQVSDASNAQLKVTLAPPTDFGGSALQFKQHPNVAKFTPNTPRIIALKDSSKAFPVGQSLAVLKWRYAGTDESNVPLSSAFQFSIVVCLLIFIMLVNCWPSPSNDGTCEVSIEYELENENLTLYDVVISIPLP